MSFNILDIESDLNYCSSDDFDLMVVEILKCKEAIDEFNCLAFQYDCDILLESVRTYDVIHNALHFYKMHFNDRLSDFIIEKNS